ncbi:CBS domain-containing protein [Omnitrophica bacterium]|nr:CBS domain-containing protein [Candidatus Omnitrophota bacterium]
MATVKDIMVKKVVTVSEDESLEGVCKLLVTRRLSGVPVVDKKNNLAGFISERDIIAAVGTGDFADKRVSDVMTRKVVSVEEDKPIEQVSQIFTDKPIRHIPVTKSSRLVGIVSRKDIINKLLGQYY